MNKQITLIQPRCREEQKTMRLRSVLDFALEGYEYELIETAEEAAAADLHGKRLLFAIELGESGINLEYVKLLKAIRLNRDMFEGCVAGIVVDGNSELFTKSVAWHMVFSQTAPAVHSPVGRWWKEPGPCAISISSPRIWERIMRRPIRGPCGIWSAGSVILTGNRSRGRNYWRCTQGPHQHQTRCFCGI
jgi:hypothetical protein